MSDPWAFIDAVFCITLDTATTRHAKVQVDLERVNLWPKTTMLVVQRDPRGGVRGCYESHQRVWNSAREKGVTNVLVLEDDVFFSNDWAKYLPYAQKFVEGAVTPWDCLFLGWAPFRSQKTPWKHIAKITCGTATTAYIASRTALERGLPPFNDIPIDVYLLCQQCTNRQRQTIMSKCFRKPSMFNVFGLLPNIAFQRYDKTSSTGTGSMGAKRLGNIKLMRFFGNTSTVVDTPTMVFILGLTSILLFLGIVATVIAVPIVVMKKKKKKALQGGGVDDTLLLVPTLLPLMFIGGLGCGGIAYNGRGYLSGVRLKEAPKHPEALK